MIHIVTGTPGTGKTTFAKNYAETNNFEYIDGKEIIKDYGLVESFDSKTNSDIIDEIKFAQVCEGLIEEAKQEKKDIIIDSHLSQFIDSKVVNTCFVTHCDLKALQRRLKQRGYSDKKVKDNLEAEIFRECEIEAQKNNHKIEIINCD